MNRCSGFGWRDLLLHMVAIALAVVGKELNGLVAGAFLLHGAMRRLDPNAAANRRASSIIIVIVTIIIAVVVVLVAAVARCG